MSPPSHVGQFVTEIKNGIRLTDAMFSEKHNMLLVKVTSTKLFNKRCVIGAIGRDNAQVSLLV